MPTLAVVGYGPQLGAAVARRFAREGFAVGLVARDAERLADQVAQLGALDVRAEGFTADVHDGDTVRSALAGVERGLGAVDVLLYAPAPSAQDLREQPPVGALELTRENVRRALDLQLFGALDAAQAVLPGMLDRGRGTIIATTGLTGAAPAPMVTDLHVACAALRQWLSYLDVTTAPRGVRAIHVGIAAFIGQGRPGSEPAAIADAIWQAHADPVSATVEYVDLPTDWQGMGLSDKFS